MRQRRVSGIEEKLARYSDLILQPAIESSAGLSPQDTDHRTSSNVPSGRYARWYQRSSPRYSLPEGYGRIYAEFGCGRGLFINTLAEWDRDGLYIGVEGCKTIVYQAIKKTHAAGLKNIFYIDEFINNADTAFDGDSLDGVFLNFSDPWPKDRHAERRLTAPAKADSYSRILKPKGFAAFKSDKEAFFDYSMQSFLNAGFEIESASRDLELKPEHHVTEVSDFAAAAQTEYEQKFRALGQPVCYFLARKH